LLEVRVCQGKRCLLLEAQNFNYLRISVWAAWRIRARKAIFLMLFEKVGVRMVRAKPRFGLLAVHSDETTLPEHPSRDSSRRGIQKQPGTAHTLLLTGLKENGGGRHRTFARKGVMIS
jgi:hypothetical protein